MIPSLLGTAIERIPFIQGVKGDLPYLNLVPRRLGIFRFKEPEEFGAVVQVPKETRRDLKTIWKGYGFVADRILGRDGDAAVEKRQKAESAGIDARVDAGSSGGATSTLRP